MVDRLVAVGDDFTLPTAVKVGDVNLPTRLGDANLSTKIAGLVEPNLPVRLSDANLSTKIAGLVEPNIPSRLSDAQLKAAYGHGESVLAPGSAVVADGVTDTTAALNALFANAAGKHLRFPKGTYKVDGQLNVAADDVWIQLDPGAVIDASAAPGTRTTFVIEKSQAGMPSTTIGGGDTSKGSRVLTLAASTAFAAGDLIFMHSTETFNEDSDNGSWRKGELLFVASASGSTVNLKTGLVDNYTQAGQTITVTKVNPVRGFRLTGGGKVVGSGTGTQSGIYLNNGIDPVIEGITVEAFTTRNIALSNVIGGAVLNSTSKRANLDGIGYGIQIGQTSRGVRVSNNHVEGCRHGIDTSSGSIAGPVRDVVISGNTIFDCDSAGISNHGGTENTTIFGNTIDSCGGGIVNRSAKCAIIGNTIIGGVASSEDTDTYQNGIWLAGRAGGSGLGDGATDCIVADNIINMHADWTGLTAMGISVTAHMRRTRISGNIISGFSGHGIHISATLNSDSHIVGNVINCDSQAGSQGATSLHGIGFAIAEAAKPNFRVERFRISGNTILNPRYHGISMWFGTTTPQAVSRDIIITENTVKGAGSGAIALVGKWLGGGVLIANNVLPDYSAAGTMNVLTDPISFFADAQVKPVIYGNMLGTTNRFIVSGDVEAAAAILPAANGTKYRVTVADNGALTTTAI